MKTIGLIALMIVANLAFCQKTLTKDLIGKGQGTTMCLTPDEARVINKTFNSEEYFRTRDSLCQIRFQNVEAQLRAFEMILEIDSLNASDRVAQVMMWKQGYEEVSAQMKNRAIALMEMEAAYEKEKKRKKRWRGVALAGVPVAFAGGIIFVILQ